MDGFSADEVNELAEAFSTQVSAAQLLEYAGLDRSRMPAWQAESATSFWAQVSALLSAGILVDGRSRILQQAAATYPGNSVFAAASGGRRSPSRRLQRSHSRAYQIGASRVTVRHGNIVDLAVDVLVSSDDSFLSMGGGVSAAIRARAGNALDGDVLKAGSNRLGDVVVTTAGALSARYVFHVVTIGPEGQIATKEDIETSVRECLVRMEMLGVSSLAFPVLGTGTAGLTIEESARGMVKAICGYLKDSKALDVSIVLYAASGNEVFDYLVFYEELSRQASPVQGEVEGNSQAASTADKMATAKEAKTLVDLERERQILESELVQCRIEGRDESSIKIQLEKNFESRVALEARERQKVESSVSIFISYSHRDDALRSELTKHLANLRRNQVIKYWHDRKIVAGEYWAEEIDSNLEKSRIILFLLSPDFMESDYCVDIEAMRAIELHKKGKACLIPIVLRPVDWEGSIFSVLQALPTDARPITDWDNQDSAFVDVVKGIGQVAVRLRGK